MRREDSNMRAACSSLSLSLRCSRIPQQAKTESVQDDEGLVMVALLLAYIDDYWLRRSIS